MNVLCCHAQSYVLSDQCDLFSEPKRDHQAKNEISYLVYRLTYGLVYNRLSRA